MLGLCYYGGCHSVAVLGLLSAVASLFAEHRLSGVWASVAAGHGPSSCGSEACEQNLAGYGTRV